MWKDVFTARDNEGRTGVMLAARGNQHVLLGELLKVADSVEEVGKSVEEADKGGETSLHLAAKHVCAEAVDQILETIAPWPKERRCRVLNIKDKKGRTALDQANKAKSFDISKKLEGTLKECAKES